MRLLLDTQAFLWWASSPEKLSPRARRAIEDNTNEVFVSAATAWEIAIKAHLGRLELTEDPRRFVPAQIAEHSFQPLPVQIHHAVSVAGLPDIHRDPFDRLLVAQAMVENLSLATADRKLREYGVKVVW